MKQNEITKTLMKNLDLQINNLLTNYSKAFNNIENKNYVYFLLDPMNNKIKIGIGNGSLHSDGTALNYRHRIKRLQHISAGTIRVLFITNQIIESATHKKFKHLSQHGEFFTADKELLDYIEQLKIEYS